MLFLIQQPRAGGKERHRASRAGSDTATYTDLVVMLLRSFFKHDTVRSDDDDGDDDDDDDDNDDDDDDDADKNDLKINLWNIFVNSRTGQIIHPTCFCWSQIHGVMSFWWFLTFKNSWFHSGLVIDQSQGLKFTQAARVDMFVLGRAHGRIIVNQPFLWGGGGFVKGAGWLTITLGAGFRYIWMFTPTWENDRIRRAYFSDGFQPTTRWAPSSYKWSWNPYKWPYKWS